jgi:hypothetical protein
MAIEADRVPGFALEESGRRMGDMQAVMVDSDGEVSAASDPCGAGKAGLV